jgi:hypothetical protein
LPPEVYSAKTIAIVNHTGTQATADRAYDELQKWGRFAAVIDPDKADVVMVVSMSSKKVGATGQTYGGNVYVTDRRVVDVTTAFLLHAEPEPFFSETERAVLFRRSATKRCVDDFRERLEETAKP